MSNKSSKNNSIPSLHILSDGNSSQNESNITPDSRVLDPIVESTRRGSLFNHKKRSIFGRSRSKDNSTSSNKSDPIVFNDSPCSQSFDSPYNSSTRNGNSDYDNDEDNEEDNEEDISDPASNRRGGSGNSGFGWFSDFWGSGSERKSVSNSPQKSKKDKSESGLLSSDYFNFGLKSKPGFLSRGSSRKSSIRESTVSIDGPSRPVSASIVETDFNPPNASFSSGVNTPPQEDDSNSNFLDSRVISNDSLNKTSDIKEKSANAINATPKNTVLGLQDDFNKLSSSPLPIDAADTASEVSGASKGSDRFFKKLTRRSSPPLGINENSDDLNIEPKTAPTNSPGVLSFIGRVSPSESPKGSTIMSIPSSPVHKGHAKRASVTSILFRKSSNSDVSRSESVSRKGKVPEEDLMMMNLMHICTHILPFAQNDKRTDRVIDLLSACALFAGDNVSISWWYNQEKPLVYVCTPANLNTVVDFLEMLIKLLVEAVDVFTKTQDFGFELRLFPSVGHGKPLPPSSASSSSKFLNQHSPRSLSPDRKSGRRDSTDSAISAATDTSTNSELSSDGISKKKPFGSKLSQYLINALDFTLPLPDGTHISWEERLTNVLFNNKTHSCIIKFLQENQQNLDIFRKLRITEYRNMVYSRTVKSALLGQLKTKGKKLPSDNYLIYYMKSNAKGSGDSAKFKVYIEKYIAWLEGIQTSISKIKSMNPSELHDFCRLFYYVQGSICFPYVHKSVVQLYSENSKKVGVSSTDFDVFTTRVGRYYQDFQTIYKSISQRDFAQVFGHIRIVPISLFPPQSMKVKPWNSVLINYGFSAKHIRDLEFSSSLDGYQANKTIKIQMDPEVQLMDYIWKRHYLPNRRRFICYIGSSKPSLRMAWEISEVIKDYGAHFQLGQISGSWNMCQIPDLSVNLQHHETHRLGLDDDYAHMDMKKEIVFVLREYIQFFLEKFN